MSVNRVTLVGNPGGDPELRHLPSGQLVVGFSIATDQVFTDEQGQRHEHAEWRDVVAFGKLAETCGQYLKQGRQVYVEAVCGRGSSRRGTMAASVSAPRLSLRASSFSAPRRSNGQMQPKWRSRRSRRQMKRRSERWPDSGRNHVPRAGRLPRRVLGAA